MLLWRMDIITGNKATDPSPLIGQHGLATLPTSPSRDQCTEPSYTHGTTQSCRNLQVVTLMALCVCRLGPSLKTGPIPWWEELLCAPSP